MTSDDGSAGGSANGGRLALGVALIAVGLFISPWTVARLLTGDGRIGSAELVHALLGGTAVCIGLGVLCLAGPTRRGRTLTWTFLVFWGLFYGGWVFARSYRPDIGWYSWEYFVFLVILTVPFAVPWVIRYMHGRLGGRQTLFAFVPLLVLGVVGYAVGGWWYHGVRTQRFDPFLQYPTRLMVPDPVPEADLRVLALGGSTTESRSLAPEDRYPTRLETLLSDADGARDVRVYNAGRAWYSTRHSLSTYSDHYYRLRPDVLVVMHAINDLYRSCTPQAFSSGAYNDRWTHYYGASIRGVRPYSLWKWLVDAAVPGETDPADMWYSAIRHHPASVPVERFVSIGPYEAYLDRLVEIAMNDGVRVVLVTQPSIYAATVVEREELHLGMAERFCLSSDDYMRRTYPDASSMEAAMGAFNAIVRRVASCRGAVLADAAASLDGRPELFSDDVHHTPRGSAAIAEIVAPAVETAVANPPPEAAGCAPA